MQEEVKNKLRAIFEKNLEALEQYNETEEFDIYDLEELVFQEGKKTQQSLLEEFTKEKTTKKKRLLKM
jgi:hypothetical protein